MGRGIWVGCGRWVELSVEVGTAKGWDGAWHMGGVWQVGGVECGGGQMGGVGKASGR